MSNDIVQARYDQLDDIANKFARKAQEAAQMQQRILRDAQALQNGGWMGAGSQAFSNEMNSVVQPAMQRLIVALETASSTTKEIKQIMLAAEEEASRPFKSSGNGLVNSLLQAGTALINAGSSALNNLLSQISAGGSISSDSSSTSLSGTLSIGGFKLTASLTMPFNLDQIRNTLDIAGKVGSGAEGLLKVITNPDVINSLPKGLADAVEAGAPILKGAKSIISKAGHVLNALDLGLAYVQDGNSFGDNSKIKAGEIIGGIILGKGLATVGGAIGTAIFPGVGTAIGIGVGGFVGSWAGGELGKYLTKTFVVDPPKQEPRPSTQAVPNFA
jgi:WXG100 family type VII secretion target